MLYNIESKCVDHLPHEEEFHQRRAKIPDEIYDNILMEINQYCNKNNQASATRFKTGNRAKSVWEPLYDALDKDEEETSMFLGQILWEVLRISKEKWYFDRPPYKGEDIPGMTYWR